MNHSALFNMFENKEESLDDDEEDVVIAGSQLHETLFKMGYSDYEVVPAINGKSPTGTIVGKFTSKHSMLRLFGEKLSEFYRHLMKDSRTVKMRLKLISEAEHLLNDHSAFVKNLLDESNQTQLRVTEKLLTCSQYVAEAMALFSLVNRPYSFGPVMILPALIAVRFKYAKYRTNRDMRNLLSEQTELHYIYKKGLRILKQFFTTKNSVKQSAKTRFAELTAEKLKFLQPVSEKMLQSLGSLAGAYYRTTLSLANILPDFSRRIIDSQITRFDAADLLICGEITYETLKQLFYRFILIQSEMLLTFAVFINCESNGVFDQMKRTVVAEERIEKLLKLTNTHRMSFGRMIDDFHNYKLATAEYKYRGFRGSKWQDLYIRLYLTSHKMQNAYNTLSSVLEDIENHLDRRTDETELLAKLKIRLGEVCEDAHKARDLAQLSVLIISKMERVNSGEKVKNGESQGDPLAQNSRLDLPIVRDSDPEIVDEVFEEYIRERYSEGIINDAGDDYLESSYKLDILLSKHLMSELKEALIDKEKDTKERESRALERMGNRNARNIPANDETREIVPSDIEATETESITADILSANESRETETETGKLNSAPKPPPLPMKRDLNRLVGEGKDERKSENEKDKGKEIDRQIPSCFIPLPNSAPVSLTLFLSNNEETFTGSGENSDEELVDIDESLENTEDSES